MLKRAKKINQNQQMATCKVFVIPNKYKESPTIYHHKKFGYFDFKDAENNLVVACIYLLVARIISTNLRF